MNFRRALSRCLAVALTALAGSVSAQALLFGLNASGNNAGAPPGSFGLYTLDYNTGAITGGKVITVPARVITGANGFAQDPNTGRVYAIVKANAVAGRLLITLNLSTGAGVEIGNLGDNFSSLAFRGDGQLFGVTGDGATVPTTLYLINKANASKVVATTLGNGNDGEVITFHPPSNSFFHWSGNGVSVFERIRSSAPYTVTPITAGGWSEIFGAVWDPTRNQFLVTDINDIMDFWTTAGVRSNAQPATVSAARGLILVLNAGGVPTLSQWAMIALALLMACAGFAVIHRRS